MEDEPCISILDIRCRLIVGWGDGLQLLSEIEREEIHTHYGYNNMDIFNDLIFALTSFDDFS